MKTILCYGDSNTWGYIPRTNPDPVALPQRYGWTERWPGVLRQQLGDGYRVIEEGLNARTTVWDDPIEGLHKNGKTYTFRTRLLTTLAGYLTVDEPLQPAEVIFSTQWRCNWSLTFTIVLFTYNIFTQTLLTPTQTRCIIQLLLK